MVFTCISVFPFLVLWSICHSYFSYFIPLGLLCLFSTCPPLYPVKIFDPQLHMLCFSGSSSDPLMVITHRTRLFSFIFSFLSFPSAALFSPFICSGWLHIYGKSNNLSFGFIIVITGVIRREQEVGKNKAKSPECWQSSSGQGSYLLTQPTPDTKLNTYLSVLTKIHCKDLCLKKCRY